MRLQFDNVLGPWRELDWLLGATAATEPRWSPRFDVEETDNTFVLRGDVPGLSQKDLEVRIDDNVLRVSGDRAASEDKVRLVRRERSSGRFERSFRLPETVNTDKVEASYKDGVLVLTLPKQAPIDTSRLIAVQ